MAAAAEVLRGKASLSRHLVRQTSAVCAHLYAVGSDARLASSNGRRTFCVPELRSSPGVVFAKKRAKAQVCSPPSSLPCI